MKGYMRYPIDFIYPRPKFDLPPLSTPTNALPKEKIEYTTIQLQLDI